MISRAKQEKKQGCEVERIGENGVGLRVDKGHTMEETRAEPAQKLGRLKVALLLVPLCTEWEKDDRQEEIGTGGSSRHNGGIGRCQWGDGERMRGHRRPRNKVEAKD